MSAPVFSSVFFSGSSGSPCALLPNSMSRCKDQALGVPGRLSCSGGENPSCCCGHPSCVQALYFQLFCYNIEGDNVLFFAVSPSLFTAFAPLLNLFAGLFSGVCGRRAFVNSSCSEFFMPRPQESNSQPANPGSARPRACSLVEFRSVFGCQLSLAAPVALVLGIILGKAAFLSALAGVAVVLLPSWWQARALVRCTRNETAVWRFWCRSHLGKWLGMTALLAAFVIGGRETLNFPVFFTLILISQLAVLPALFIKSDTPGAQSR